MLFPPPRDLPNPGIEHVFLCVLHWQADSLPLSYMRSPLLMSVVLKGLSHTEKLSREKEGHEQNILFFSTLRNGLVLIPLWTAKEN